MSASGRNVVDTRSDSSQHATTCRTVTSVYFFSVPDRFQLPPPQPQTE